jgi:hypothetical protein
MELKTIGKYETEQLSDFLGIAPERVKALSLKCVKHYVIYLKDIMNEDAINAKRENILIESVVKEAETFEEAIYIASAVHITISSILEQEVDRLKKEKEEHGLQ